MYIYIFNWDIVFGIIPLDFSPFGFLFFTVPFFHDLDFHLGLYLWLELYSLVDGGYMEKTSFTSNIIEETRFEFARLLTKFQSMDDPIERYIKRQEMAKLKSILEEFGEHVEIPWFFSFLLSSQFSRVLPIVLISFYTHGKNLYILHWVT